METIDGFTGRLSKGRVRLHAGWRGGAHSGAKMDTLGDCRIDDRARAGWPVSRIDTATKNVMGAG